MWGAGLSNGCVINVGAQSIDICCVEDGFSNASSRWVSSLRQFPLIIVRRVHLNYGGDAITKLLYDLLVNKSDFPYKECDLSLPYDFALVDKMKQNICTFKEVCVA